MLAAIGLLSTTFGVSVASALIPLISIELFTVGVVLNGPHMPWWLLTAVIATGQIGGKLLHFYAARGIIRLPRITRRKPESERRGRWRAWLDTFRASCHSRPLWTAGILLLSAAASMPPFAAIAWMAGWARVPLATFVLTGFAGRFARFAALTIAPGLMLHWF